MSYSIQRDIEVTLKSNSDVLWPRLKMRFRNLFDTLKNTDSKIFLVHFLRVEEYIKAGKDKNIVDPDENKVYTKRK